MKLLSLLVGLSFCSVSFANYEYIQTKNVESIDENAKPIFKALGIYKVDAEKTKNMRVNKNLEKFLKTKMTLRTAEVNEKGFWDWIIGGEDETSPDNAGTDSFQWALESSDKYGINPAAAWEITKGGMNANGEEIVIAIVDGGFDVSHSDLIPNTWVNQGEIADNGIDDDGNGYIDDMNGWDISSNSNKISSDTHGTHVAGIAGAYGDDNFITGVNWNVKIMYLSVGWGLGDTEKVLEAYNYILEQKKMWIESNGQKGANVVSVNSSFGIDYADCGSGDYTLWNDVYDALGEQGILSVAATANRNVNVDVSGDVPTSCTSPYVVAVTNSTLQGKKTSSAGYGLESIDLAAPGTNILSLYPNERTQTLSGTSMSTPHVAGAIGLLHSAASMDFYYQTLADPGASALILKDIIMGTVTPVSSMQGKMVAPGILNLGDAATTISEYVAPTE